MLKFFKRGSCAFLLAGMASIYASDAAWRVPLTLTPEGEGLEEEVIFAGVPFPKEMLSPDVSVVVVDDKGNPVPTSSRVMALWPETNSVRWLGVNFLGRAAGQYFVMLGKPPEPGARLLVEPQGENYQVETGPARFVLSRTGPLLSEAGLLQDGTFRPLIQNSEGNDLYLVDHNGREAFASGDASGQELRLETASPLEATFRREGWYVTPQGEKLARHITRLHFYAGQPYCRIEHSLIVTESTDKVWFREYGLRFRYAPGASPVEVVFPDSDKPDATLQKVPFAEGTRDIFLFQEKAFWLSRMDEAKDCHFEIGKTTDGGKNEALHTGTLAGDWVQAHSLVGSMSLVVRGFWKMFPEELRCTPKALEVLFWSSRGGDELDFRMDAVRKRLPEEWLNDGVNKDFVDEVRKMETDAQGVARSHEILLDLAPPGETPPRERLQTFSKKTVALADPAWLRQSEAMGRFHPYDPEQFPEEESFMETFFDQQMEIYQQWGEFGFFNYGAGPHVWFFKAKSKELAGRWIPALQRYPLNYGFSAHLWRMFARSGQRKYFDVADRMTKYRLDLGMVHWPSANKRKGNYQSAIGGGGWPVPWASASSFHTQSGSDLRELAWLYYLTDYRPAHEMLEDYNRAVKEVWNSQDQSPLRKTRPFASLKNLATVYQEIGDPELKKIIEEQTRWLADLEAPQGVAEEKELTGLAKYGVKSGAMQRVAEVLDDEAATQSLIKGAATIASEPSGRLPLTYYNSEGEQVSEAYHRTGDPIFARTLARDMALALSTYRNESGKGWKPIYPELGPCSALSVYPLGGMAFAMDALAEYRKREGHSVEMTPFARQAGQGRKVLGAFEKPAGRTVQIDLRSSQPLSPRVLRADGLEINGITKEVFTDQLETRRKIPTRVVLTVPENLSGGTYLLDPGVEGEPWEVTWTDAPKLVLVAPGGLVAGPGGRAWGDRIMPATLDHPAWLFFQVPKGVSSFQVQTSASLHLRRPSGQTIFLPNQPVGSRTIEVPAGEDGKLWAFQAAGPRFVRISGVPPFFAYGEPERFFVPELPEGVLSRLGEDFPDLAGSPAPASPYGPTETALASASGVSLAEGRHVILPGANTLIHPQEGTIEFWLRPFRPSVAQFGDPNSVRTILKTGSWEILLHRYGEMSVTVSAGADAKSPAPATVEANASAALESDRWNHIAVQWSGAGKNFRWEIFVNGRLWGAITDTSQDGEMRSTQGVPFLPAAPGSEILLGSTAQGLQPLQALMAGLRFSSVRRYERTFQPDPASTLQNDSRTIGVFAFDQTTEGQGPGHRPLPGMLKEK